jgi:ABC-2 type transport system permease protein
MTSGLLHHLWLTLKLNFRSKQAIVYGYVVPIFFLVAFGSVFHNDSEPLIGRLGQLMTISILGGACFGMPTSMVSERERGVWRRFRLLPAATGGLVLSNMVARFVIVFTAAVMQIGLALWFYKMPAPQHPGQMIVAFTFACFAFLGMGLVIAMMAENVPAVQAMGQCIFLPMIMIGGVGVPLRSLPAWAQHVAAFLPGRYAVEAIQACAAETAKVHGLHDVVFSLIALTVIGAAGCWAGANMFRWDAGQKLTATARAWLVPAIASWAAVGLAAEYRQRAVLFPPERQIASVVHATTAPQATQPGATTLPTTEVASLTPSTSAPATEPAVDPAAPWNSVTQAQIDSITYDDLEGDNGAVTPILRSLDDLDDAGKKRLSDFEDNLSKWEPGKEDNLQQRVLNLLSVAGLADVLQDELEGAFPIVIFNKLKDEVPKPELTKVVAYIVLHPDEGKVLTNVSELDINGDQQQGVVRERVIAYAKKLLYRLLGKMNDQSRATQ